MTPRSRSRTSLGGKDEGYSGGHLDAHGPTPKKVVETTLPSRGPQRLRLVPPRPPRFPFPSRVDQKCQTDPSLAVAHHCFWKHHPAKAYAWELRLKHELRPDFTIDEPGSDEARTRYLADQPEEAAAIREKEEARRERLRAKQSVGEEEPG